MDDPRHGEIRRMLGRDFTPRRVKELRPVIERTVSSVLDAMLAGTAPVDLYEAFSLPVASGLIGELLGVPAAARGVFSECTNTIVSRTSSIGEVSAADDQLYDFCVRLIEDKEKGEIATDDLIGRLLRTNVRTGQLSREELCLTVKMIIVSGHETASNMISLGGLTMLLRPDWFGAMRQGPDTAANAVEELLRYHTLLHVGLPRVATEDTVVGGTRICAGEGIIASLASGNRDEGIFAQPDVLDMRRENARYHLSFGDGVHQCLGKWMAREELKIAFRALATRIPTLRLAVPFEELSFKEDRLIYGLYQLPVVW